MARPSPPSTKPPPPPDPLDAADHYHARAQRQAAEFRYSDETDEPSTVTGTGSHAPVNVTVHVDRASSHEIAPLEGKKPNAGGIFAAAIMLLATAVVAVCRVLGWIK